MDAVGHILAERYREPFPWATGVSLAILLHAVIGAGVLLSTRQTTKFVATRTVSVRLLPAGALRRGAREPVAPSQPEKPKIVKPPPEEEPPPPTEKAKLLPAKEEKKKPAPAPVEPSAPRKKGDAPAASGASEGGRAGGGAAATGAGVGIGGAKFDQPDFTYSYYAERISLAIGMNWFKPATTIPTSPVVHFRIARDGTVSEAEITASSGLPFVDRAALRAVLASSPLPPLPSEFAGSSVGVSVVFD